MTDDHDAFVLSPTVAIGSCLALAAFFVSSLYVWRPFGAQERSDPANVKRRFLSVSVVMALSPLLVVYLLHQRTAHPVHHLMGLRLSGLPAAIVLPLLLTVILFAGPLYVQWRAGELHAKASLSYWRTATADIFWLRNHIVAPLAEEFTFRACMMPLLLAAVRPAASLALTPLFFGVAHLHHALERYQAGMPAAQIAVLSLVQFTFTSVFGVYSAYLFARTGHYVAPMVVHAFCNHMGVPDFGELLARKEENGDVWLRWRVRLAYVVGLVGWWWLLPVLTQPALYGNVMYWQ